LALHWIEAPRSKIPSTNIGWLTPVQSLGTIAFVFLLIAQMADLAKPLILGAKGVPYSRSADAARVLRRPDLNGAIVMADPDLLLEPLTYYADNPLWFLREEKFGKIFLKTRSDRQQISLDDILHDADQLHRRYRRPIVILLAVDLEHARPGVYQTAYRDSTVLTPAGIEHFISTTRLIARLRPAITDERYDLYLYGA
jgi:hypothetical protein